jgi:outer membrane protein OmpA-like peptidoglycan-associated protein
MVFLVFALSVNAQYYSYSQHINHADKAFDAGNYIEALIHYQKGTEINKDIDIDVLYNYAEAAYRTNSYTLSDSLFRIWIDEENVIDEHVARYKMAEMQLHQGNYSDAMVEMDIYLSEYGDIDTSLTKNINLYRNSAQWALDNDTENNFYPAESESDVNSPFSEHAPYLLDDELYYNSLKFPIEDDEYQRYTSKIMKQLEVADIPGTEHGSIISHPSFTPDGDFIFFTLGEYTDTNTIRCDIYYAPMGKDGSIGKSVKLPSHINKAGYTSTHPSISYLPDSSMQLLFVSDRLGGRGGLDIWRSKILNGFEFSDPQNLLELNTEYNELSPFHHEESESLYFSTDGRVGFGGLDIYRVGYSDIVRGDIENLGSNINSPTNDLYFFLTEDESQSYLSSNRAGSQYIDSQFESCCYDIYSADARLCTVDLQLLAKDNNTKELLDGVNAKLIDKETGEQFYNGIISQSNTIEVPCNDNIEVILNKQGYEDLIFDLGAMDGKAGQDNSFVKDAFMTPLDYSLTVKVINGVDMSSINQASVYVTNLTTNEVSEIEMHDSNVFTFAIEPDTDYLVEINKDGYKESSFEFRSGINDTNVERIIELRLLDKVEKALLSLGNAIPVSLYFDNDQPDSGTLATTSTKNYTQSYNQYYARRDKFKNVHIANSVNKLQASQEIDALFDNDIKRGFEKYDIFKNQLLLVLQNNQEVNIYLRGFASPVAASDYNTSLGKRRIDSVRKEFYDWNGGVLVPYIESKLLIITERSFGESTSPNNISDNASAPALSIYSPQASRERRVEIDEIQFNNN